MIRYFMLMGSLFYVAVVSQYYSTVDPTFLQSALPNMIEKELIFMPVNDHSSFNPGGSHWSLLVFYRPLSSFYHYDSLKSYNSRAAHEAMIKVSPFLACFTPIFTEMPVPSQENGKKKEW